MSDDCFGDFSEISDKCENCLKSKKCQDFQAEEIRIQNGLAPIIENCPLKDMWCKIYNITGCKRCEDRRKYESEH